MPRRASDVPEVWSHDGGRDVDWGRTAEDYARHRPGYPESFFARLRELGVGLPGQRILDLATGTGALALPFARAGAEVTGLDLAPRQVAAARRLARQAGLDVPVFVAEAERTGLPDASFDVVTASQCRGYFRVPEIWAELRRLLAPGGRYVTCHLCWSTERDPIARRSVALVLEHVPDWTGGQWEGETERRPPWVPDDWEVTDFLAYEEAIPMTRESWRGRFRACRATGASMPPEELARFDAAHEELLERTAPLSFDVLHRIDAHVLAPR